MKANWLLVVSFKTELLTESLIHKGYRESLPKLLPQLPPFRNRMIIDNDIYIDLNETNKIQEYFSSEIIKKASGVYKAIEEQSEKLLSVANEAVKNVTEDDSNEKLSNNLSTFFFELQKTIGAIGVPTIIDLELESQIKEILERNNIKDIDFVFPHLAISFKPVETAREKEDLLDITIKVSENDISTDSNEFNNLTQEHFDKYGWIHSTLFLGDLYNEKEITQEIKSLKEHAKRSKEKLLEERTKLVAEANEIIERIASNEDKEKIKFLQRAVFYRTARLEWMNKACFIVRPLLEKAAKRFNVSFNDIIYMLPEEIHASLMDGNVRDSIIEKIRDRHRGYAYISDYENEYLLLTHSELDEWKAKFSKDHDSDIVKGIVTCKGNAEGKVVIVRDRSELHKVEQGCVLVTPLTTPDFVMAMKKSIGIVTDLGGITSHAAVTSRELGIPCIVGTKNATKVLKDGDIVKLDTKKGIVNVAN